MSTSQTGAIWNQMERMREGIGLDGHAGHSQRFWLNHRGSAQRRYTLAQLRDWITFTLAESPEILDAGLYEITTKDPNR